MIFDDFFLNYIFDGWDVLFGLLDDIMKMDFVVLGFDGGIWCLGLGKMIELIMYVVCMGVICCSVCIYVEMEYLDWDGKYWNYN